MDCCSFNGAHHRGECYTLGRRYSEGDTLSLRPDGSLCIMEAFSRSHSGDWAQLKSGHVQRPSQHLLNAELSWLVGGRAPSEQQAQINIRQQHHPYDSLGGTTASQSNNKSDHDSGPKLEDFLGGASSLGGQYTTTSSRTSDSQTHSNNSLENLYFRDINVNLSPYSGSAGNGAGGATQQQWASHVPPSFHAYGLQQRTDDNSAQQQPYDSHSRHNHTAAASAGVSAATSADPSALCHPNVYAQNLMQVAFVDHQQHHHHNHLGGGDSSPSTSAPATAADNMLQDCTLQLPPHQGPNLSALKTWLCHSQVAAAAGNVGSGGSSPGGTNIGGGGGEKPGIGKLNNGSCSIVSINAAGLHHQSLSLSMSPVSQSSNSLAPAATSDSSPETRKRVAGTRAGSKEASPRKSIDTFGQRTSVFRGVTRHRWTGRYEAHLWDNSCRKEGQTRKGRQVYLGGYDKEEKAARAYDLAALKYWGPNTTINFPLQQYEKELEEMKNMTRQEYVASLRRKSSGFSRGASVYRGVTRHHQHGRWQARIGRVAGNKDLYLGTYSTQEEAAEAYDIAAIKFRGINAVTNFDISRYDTKRICGTLHNAIEEESPKMPGLSSSKELAVMGILDQPSDPSVDGHQTDDDTQSLQTGNTNSTSQLTDGLMSKSHLQDWQMLYHSDHHAQQQQQQQRSWDDLNNQQQQQQDVKTQTLISDSLGHKFLQSAQGNMHSAVLRNLMGFSNSGASGSESSGGMLAGLHRSSSSSLIGGGGSSGFPGVGGAPSPNSLCREQHSDNTSASQCTSASAHHSDHHHNHNQHQQQDVRTQTFFSDSLGHKFLQSPHGNMHSAVLRNLMGLSDSGASGSESSGRMLAGLHGSSSSSLIGGGGGNSGFPGGRGGAPNPKSLCREQHSEDDSSKGAGGGGQTSAAAHSYENVLQGDLSRHILFMPHSQSSPAPPSGSTKSSSSYDNSSLGNQSWMTNPQGNLNQRVSAAGHLGDGHMPIFAVWND
ncbi:hypothetical protein R1flu_028994 [Riccia fluitans]|uniref:AP2/ERF domain-containing protein n=1 Tax=Riccia fluitans TaxID=41844 RepID=A0ABD1XR92_9MARC